MPEQLTIMLTIYGNFRVNSGIRGGGIDWELVKSYMPDYVKKTRDREYRADADS